MTTSLPPGTRNDLFLGLPKAVARVLLPVFAIALLGYLMLWRSAPVMAVDSRAYLDMAEDLRDLSLDRLTIRTPVYPLLLLATGSLPRPGKVLFVTSLLLHAGSVWLLAAVLRAAGLSHRLLMVFALLAWLPIFVQTAATVLTENLAQFFLAASFALFLWGLIQDRVSTAIASGVCCSLLALTRPAFQLVAIYLAAVVVICGAVFQPQSGRLRRLFLYGLVLALVSGAILIGYSYYYYTRFGYFGITYQAGINLCDRTAHFIDRLPSSYEPLRTYLIEGRNDSLIRGESHTAEQYPWDHWRDLKAKTDLDDVQLAKLLLRANADLILHNPLNYLQAVLMAIASMMMPYHTRLLFASSKLLQALWSVLHFGLLSSFFVQVAVVAGAELLDLSRRYLSTPGKAARTKDADTLAWEMRLAYYLSLSLVVYTIVISATADIGNPRYRAPSDLLLLANLVIGAAMWRRRC